MTQNGYARKEVEGEELSSAFVPSNSDLDALYRTFPFRDYLHVQFLRYIAHVVRRDNAHPTKTALFIEATRKNVKSIWVKVQFLMGCDKEDCIRKMVSKIEFNRALEARYPYLKKSATGMPNGNICLW